MKSGFVAVSGKPNVGKSTLINTILGRKAVIVSDKPQTTRNRINCIYTTKDYQIIFVDTPGIHKPLHKLGEYMVKIAISALKGVDLILFLIDPVDGVRKTDERVAEIIGKSKIPVILVVNKIDKIKDKSIIESSIEKVKPYLSNLVDIIQVSALTGENISLLLDKIIELLPEGPQYYPDDMITDRPLAFMISEIIREKIFHLTKEEIPHSTAVVVEEIKERENGIIYIRATIYVERDSQKGIIIGKNGRMIKEIGTLARMDIEHIVDSKVFLDLHVKVKEKWRRKDFLILNTMGFKSEI